jgi:hypothetical protein
MALPRTPKAPRERADQMADLFHKLAKYAYKSRSVSFNIDIFTNSLSGRAAQNAFLRNTAEQWLSSYCQLSAELAAVSPSAANPVFITLSDILVNHAESQKRVDEDVICLGRVWENILEMFVQAIVNVFDIGLDNSLDDLKAQGEHIMRDILSSASADLKKKANEISVGVSAERGRQRGNFDQSRRSDSEREHERRRARDYSKDRERERKRRRVSSGSPPPPPASADVTLLKEMQKRLELLEKENNQVWACIRFIFIVSPDMICS